MHKGVYSFSCQRILSLSGTSVLFASVLFFSSLSAHAQYMQQAKLVGIGSRPPFGQGTSVALSADGNTAIVGAPAGFCALTCIAVGESWIFIRRGTAWILQAKLVGTGVAGDSAFQGTSVALSADGNTAVVGGPDDNIICSPYCGHIGAAWVFTRRNRVWTQQAKLVGTGAIGAARQGTSVTLSADGNTAIVGGPSDNGFCSSSGCTFIGAAWVFTRRNGVWIQQAKLVGSGVAGNFGASQGSSVALSADGNTAIVGGPSDNGFCSASGCRFIGAAWVFTRSPASFNHPAAWTQQAKLVGTGVAGNFGASQGSSVALSTDGSTAIVGGSGDNGGIGAVWVFTRSPASFNHPAAWTQQAKLVGTGAIGAARQGTSVTLSADGNTALAGGPSDNFSCGRFGCSSIGAAWLFTRSNGVWAQQGNKLIGTGAIGAASQGTSVALSTDAKTAIVGGPFDDSSSCIFPPACRYTGAAWVFVRP
jgi:hypothetical protein